ncbi:MAG TPA: phage protease [Thermoanaerobaculia bacterium]|nr:phage protease [Thermoanaerobaculia bacterium]
MGGPAPEWVQIFPHPLYVGELDGDKKTWITDDISQQSCVDFFNLRKNDLVIDYEHLSDKDAEAPAAGRIVELRAAGSAGLLARVEWTERARRMIEAGEYYYDSPSFFWSRDDDRIYGLRHLALTNNPGSWGRPYITDHTVADYGIERASQRSGGERLQLVCARQRNTTKIERRERVLSNVLESLRFTVGRPAAVTGKELRDDLLKLAELVPDSDEMIFLDEAAESGTDATGKRIADLLGAEIGAATIEAASQKAGGTSADHSESRSGSSTDLTPLHLALGVASDDPRELALAVMSLKASTVPIATLREMEARLASAESRTGEERIVLEIARQRNDGKQITPAFEAELIRVAQSDFNLAKSSLDGLQLTSIDLKTQADAPAPTVERNEATRERARETAGALPANATASLKASVSAFDETIAIARDKGVTYGEANRLRLTMPRAA